MITYKFNNDIKNKMNQHKIVLHDFSLKDNERLILDFINESDKKSLKVSIPKMKASDQDFEMENAILLDINILEYKSVFKSKYFVARSLKLKEAHSDKTIIIEEAIS